MNPTKKCSRCDKTLTLDNFGNMSRSKDGKKAYCKVCEKKYHQGYYQNNKTKILAQSKDYYDNNTDSVKKRHAQYYQENKDWLYPLHQEWFKNNSELTKQYHRNYQKRLYEDSPEYVLEKNSYRRALILNVTPKWADRAKIRDIYKEARRITKETGIKHQVDHIIPLKNPYVCGLHVEDNLRIVTANENHRKSNKLLHDDLDLNSQTFEDSFEVNDLLDILLR